MPAAKGESIFLLRRFFLLSQTQTKRDQIGRILHHFGYFSDSFGPYFLAQIGVWPKMGNLIHKATGGAKIINLFGTTWATFESIWATFCLEHLVTVSRGQRERKTCYELSRKASLRPQSKVKARSSRGRQKKSIEWTASMQNRHEKKNIWSRTC